MALSKIKTNSIADNAITSTKIGVDVIVAEDLASNSITVAEIASDAVTTAKIADANVTSGKLASSITITTLTGTNDATISGLTVGKGGGAISNNTAIGNNALRDNTTGNRSVAIGFSALPANTTGEHNVAVGSTALSVNTTGSYNVGVGREALTSNTTASYNTAVGYQAGYSNTTGTQNVFQGSFAGYNNTTGGYNTAVGYNAYAVSGAAATGNYNTAIGNSALNQNTTGIENTAIGYYALVANTTASYNTAVGRNALLNCTTGTHNTVIGHNSGDTITTGTKNTILGRYNGNQGGLDIRTSSNNIVLSDGDGNPNLIINSSGNAFFNGTVSTSQGGNSRIISTAGVIGYIATSGTGALNTGIPINQGNAGASALLQVSSNGGAGTLTRQALYAVHFYYDGSNTPTLRFIQGSHDYISGGQSSGSLTLTSGYAGNHIYSWYINKSI